MDRTYHVYIMASKSGVLYIDVTGNLADDALLRVAEREGLRKIFTVDRRDFSVYRLHSRTRRTRLTLIP